MGSNLDKCRTDLKNLVEKGNLLSLAIKIECDPDKYEEYFQRRPEKCSKEELAKLKNKLPSFTNNYQAWYSEARAVIKQLLPDRLADFIKLYEKPKNRKVITFSNYSIEDCLQGLLITTGGFDKEKVVGPDAAIPRFEQQLNILKAAENRFESSLYEIKQLVQADLFDSELDVAKELLKNRFLRAAGAVASVVIEKHLRQVCENHNIVINRKDPSINDLNNLLKDNGVIDISQWRFIQHLADLRNLCDHDKKREPKPEEVEDLIGGVAKISKTLY